MRSLSSYFNILKSNFNAKNKDENLDDCIKIVTKKEDNVRTRKSSIILMVINNI